MGLIVERVMNIMKIYAKSKMRNFKLLHQCKLKHDVKSADLLGIFLLSEEETIKKYGFLPGPSLTMTNGLNRCAVMLIKKMEDANFVNNKELYV